MIFIIANVDLTTYSSADYGVDSYDVGAGFGHFGIATDDVTHHFMSLYDYFVTSTMLYFEQ